MSDAVIVALIAAGPPFVLGLANLFMAHRARAEAAAAKTTAHELGNKINSRLDLIVKQAETIAHAAGVREGESRRP